MNSGYGRVLPCVHYKMKPKDFMIVRNKDLRKETNRLEIKRVTKCPTSIFVCAFQFLFYKMTNIGS